MSILAVEPRFASRRGEWGGEKRACSFYSAFDVMVTIAAVYQSKVKLMLLPDGLCSAARTICVTKIKRKSFLSGRPP